jgi:hypothetical protein
MGNHLNKVAKYAKYRINTPFQHSKQFYFVQPFSFTTSQKKNIIDRNKILWLKGTRRRRGHKQTDDDGNVTMIHMQNH